MLALVAIIISLTVGIYIEKKCKVSNCICKRHSTNEPSQHNMNRRTPVNNTDEHNAEGETDASHSTGNSGTLKIEDVEDSS